MMSITKYQTAQVNPWEEGTRTYKGEVTYGMHYIYGDSQPYFSITGFILKSKNGQWVENSCGCLHHLIAKKKKSLAPLISFHLWGQDGLPMHYLENGYYWYKTDLSIFKNYIRLSDDELIPEVPKIPVILNGNGTEIDLPEKEQEKIKEEARKKFIIVWLKTREDKLKQEFDSTMKQFDVEFITQEEIEALKAKNKTA